MIRVTIELLPYGLEANKRNIGTLEIANDGTGTPQRGNYKVRLAKAGLPKSTWRTGAVVGFPRLKLGPYDLLLRCLTSTVGDRNPADDLLLSLLKSEAVNDPTMVNEDQTIETREKR